MKVLLTGGAGFVGSHVADELINQGYEVVIVDNLSTGKEENINQKAKFYKLDIQSPKLEKIFQEEKPDYVNHHAAQIDVHLSFSDPLFDARTNILGTINLLENCVKYKIKKVTFISSGGVVYGEPKVFPTPESHSTCPISPYGVGKLACENYLHYYKVVQGLDYVSLRYANVYGPRQNAEGEAGVVAIFATKMLNGEQPIINGDGEQTRDYVYVADVVEANLKVMNNQVSGAFNIGTGIETTVNEIFRMLKKITNSSVKEVHGPSKIGEQRRSVLDCSRAKEILGWQAKTPLEEGLKKTVDYFRKKQVIS